MHPKSYPVPQHTRLSFHLAPFHYIIPYSHPRTCPQPGWLCIFNNSTPVPHSQTISSHPSVCPAPLFPLWPYRDLKSLDSTFLSKSVIPFLTLLPSWYIISTTSWPASLACSLICPSDAKALKIVSVLQLTKPHFRLIFPENNWVIIYRLPVSCTLQLPFRSNSVLQLF